MIETYKLYGGKLNLLFDTEKHLYTANGKIVEGVTSITGIINKPALIYWAVNQCVDYLARVIKPGKEYDEIEIQSMLADAKYAHRKKSTEAANIGTLVHDAIETWIKTGKKTELINEKARGAFDLFLKWVKEENVKFLESERKVCSKKWGYAGTLDFICTIGEKRFIGDTKTSTGIWGEYWLQISGYQQAYEEEMAYLKSNIKVDGQVIVRVGKDGSFEVQKSDAYPRDQKAFNGTLVLYRRLKERENQNKRDYFNKKGGE